MSMIISVPNDDGLAELAADLMADEPFMQLLEATNRAAEMLDDLDSYAAGWDTYAAAAGNPDVRPPLLLISLIETATPIVL